MRIYKCKECQNTFEHHGVRGKVPSRCNDCKRKQTAQKWAAWKMKRAMATIHEVSE